MGDPCMQAMCECDQQFASESQNALTVRNSDNVDIFAHQCVQGPIHENVACCGDWPNVNIYSQDSMCCDGDLKVQDIGVGIGFQCNDKTIKPSFKDLFRTLSLN